jgi:hypothetical protein
MREFDKVVAESPRDGGGGAFEAAMTKEAVGDSRFAAAPTPETALPRGLRTGDAAKYPSWRECARSMPHRRPRRVQALRYLRLPVLKSPRAAEEKAWTGHRRELRGRYPPAPGEEPRGRGSSASRWASRTHEEDREAHTATHLLLAALRRCWAMSRPKASTTPASAAL